MDLQQARERVDSKLGYARIHLDEIRGYSNRDSNDAWENAHQESFFFHVVGAVDGVLHEVNAGYSLGLRAGDVKFRAIETALKNAGVSSPAFDLLSQTRASQSTWLAQAVRWRNNGAHKNRVGKQIVRCVGPAVDRSSHFFDTNGQPQTVYPGQGCLEVMQSVLSDAELGTSSRDMTRSCG